MLIQRQRLLTLAPTVDTAFTKQRRYLGPVAYSGANRRDFWSQPRYKKEGDPPLNLRKLLECGTISTFAGGHRHREDSDLQVDDLSRLRACDWLSTRT